MSMGYGLDWVCGLMDWFGREKRGTQWAYIGVCGGYTISSEHYVLQLNRKYNCKAFLVPTIPVNNYIFSFKLIECFGTEDDKRG